MKPNPPHKSPPWPAKRHRPVKEGREVGSASLNGTLPIWRRLRQGSGRWRQTNDVIVPTLTLLMQREPGRPTSSLVDAIVRIVLCHANSHLPTEVTALGPSPCAFVGTRDAQVPKSGTN